MSKVTLGPNHVEVELGTLRYINLAKLAEMYPELTEIPPEAEPAPEPAPEPVASEDSDAEIAS